jgi:hypothetical protein
MDYAKGAFGTCLTREAEAQFGPLLGCVPPWFTEDQNKVCQSGDIVINKDESVTGTNVYMEVMSGRVMLCLHSSIQPSSKQKSQLGLGIALILLNPP